MVIDSETEREQVVYEGEDFWATTTNKQLNFAQHVKSLPSRGAEKRAAGPGMPDRLGVAKSVGDRSPDEASDALRCAP